MSMMQHRRHMSDACLEEVRDHDFRSGSPRTRAKARKAFVIPGMECDGENPLKQLQRMKEEEKLATLPRSTPNINTAHVSGQNQREEICGRLLAGHNNNGACGDKSDSDDRSTSGGSSECVGGDLDVPRGLSRSDTNGNVSVVDTALPSDPVTQGEDMNANRLPPDGAAALGEINTEAEYAPELKGAEMQKPSLKRKPEVSPRHSSLLPSGFRVEIDGHSSSTALPETDISTANLLAEPFPVNTDSANPGSDNTVHPNVISPTRNKRPTTAPPPIPPIPKPKPKVIVKLVRDDPELRASQERLAKTPDKQMICDNKIDVNEMNQLNSSLKDLCLPNRNSSVYSSFKDVRGSPCTSLSGSGNNSACSSLRDIAQRQTEKLIGEEEGVYVRVENGTKNTYKYIPPQDGAVVRRQGLGSDSLNKDKRLSQSAEELDRAARALLDVTGPYLTPKSRLPDALKACSDDLYHSLGDVQTFLIRPPEEEEIYSLPQPQCYGDNTLKAVKNITEKYDTLQRRKLRAMSFRENGRYSLPSEPTSPVSDLDSGPDEVFMAGSSRPPATVKYGNGVTAKDVARLDLFYRGHGTEVYVCHCLADITFTLPPPNVEDLAEAQWEPVHNTGIPVFMLNTGKGKRKRGLFIALAERETGFTLWQDKINYLSNYRELIPGTHVMQLSTNLRRVAALRLYSREIAREFMEVFRTITGDPNDDLWKIGSPAKTAKKRWPLRRSKSKKGPRKSDISQPCHFVHVTYVDPKDGKVQECLNDAISANDEKSQKVFRGRLSTT